MERWRPFPPILLTACSPCPTPRRRGLRKQPINAYKNLLYVLLVALADAAPTRVVDAPPVGVGHGGVVHANAVVHFGLGKRRGRRRRRGREEKKEEEKTGEKTGEEKEQKEKEKKEKKHVKRVYEYR